MQTFLVHEYYDLSAQLLDKKRLFSQIYEGIHIISSLLKINDKLENSKRSVINHPIAKAWENSIEELYIYTLAHYKVWYNTVRKKPLKFETTVNGRNLSMIYDFMMEKHISLRFCTGKFHPPGLPTKEEYKKILYNKNPEYYKDWA